MDKTRLAEFAARLMKDKERLKDQITGLEETGLGDTMADSVGELSVYDNHPADLGDEMFERSKDIALRDNAHLLLEAAEAALNRIASGAYGICQSCGQDIPLARLEAMPSAARCVTCQQKEDLDGGSPRPLEEDMLQPPFHRTFLDTAPFDSIGYDGEDALQDVLRYGSSDTPQDIPGTYDYKTLFPNSNEHQGIVERTDAIPDNQATAKKTEP